MIFFHIAIALPTIATAIVVALKGDSEKKLNPFCYRLYEREKATTIAIAMVGRAITLEITIKKKKQRADTKNEAKKIKSDNCSRAIEKNLIL